LIQLPDADNAFREVEGQQSVVNIAGNALSVESMYLTVWEIGGEDEVDVNMWVYEVAFNMGASTDTAIVNNGGKTLDELIDSAGQKTKRKGLGNYYRHVVVDSRQGKPSYESSRRNQT
jgi:hypothetical protein